MGYLVLLGAGASKGSLDVDPSPPPLGRELFDELEKLGKNAAHLPKDLKDTFRENFEVGMKEYFERYNKNTMDFQRELAGYLAKFKPGNENNYIKLIRSLNSRRVVYCSLNYDLLFELSAAKLSLNITYSNIFKTGFVRLLKIHGSSNFWPDFGGAIFEDCVTGGAGRADINANIRPLNYEDTIKSSSESCFAPAIAMFAEGKQVRVCPDYIERQQQYWKESLKRVSKIFIIGVRVHQVDEHIWKEIAESKASVYYFGFEPDEIEFDTWKNDTGKKNAFFRLSDFTKAIGSIRKLCL